MLTLDEAVSRVLAHVTPRPTEWMDLRGASGRVLAAPIVATVDVPPWDNSAMDGYAVRAEDLSAAGVRLQVNEVVAAGATPCLRVEPGTATVVMTGAPMPAGADTVVMTEDSDGARVGTVTLRSDNAKGRHVRRRGEDVATGTVLAGVGEPLTSAHLALAAATGCAEVCVRVPPRVVVISTGDELVLPGMPLAPGQIYASNGPGLVAAIDEAGGQGEDAGIVSDDRDALVGRIREVAETADAVVTTGGVSAGDFDLVRDLPTLLGGGLDFWKVAMKPGKPFAWGHIRVGGRPIPFFGLPGNPVSAAVNFAQFVRPWIRTALGDPRPFLPMVDAIAGEPLPAKAGRVKFLRVVLSMEGGRLVARSAGSQSSAALRSMARSHGLAVIPAGSTGRRAGEAVRVQVSSTAFLAGTRPGYPA